MWHWTTNSIVVCCSQTTVYDTYCYDEMCVKKKLICSRVTFI